MIELLERAWVDCRWKSPETTVIEHPGFFQMLTPTNQSEAYNSVYLSRFSGSPPEINQIIDETLQRFKNVGVSYRWVVGPSAAPKDLASRLTERGMVCDHVADGLTIEVEKFHFNPIPDISVELLTHSNLEEYCLTIAEAWSLPQGMRAQLSNDIRRGLNDPSSPYLSYLARYKGEPAGTAVLHFAPGYGMLKGGSVVPRFRGKGTYRALVSHRLVELRNREIPIAATHAKKDTSSPICQRVGFQRICEFQIFHSPKT